MMWYFLMSDSFTFGAFLISYGSIRFSVNHWVDHNYVFNEFPFTEAQSSFGICKFDDFYSDLQFCYNGIGGS